MKPSRGYRPLSLLFLVMFTVSLTAPLAAEPLIVKNADPAHAPRVVTLEEVWRVGGDDDEEFFFGLMIDSCTDEAGNVYLLDNQLCEVLVFAPDGSHLQTLSGQGEGPGEVNMPQDLVLLPDGTLGIVELFPGKIVRLDLDGTPRGSLELTRGDGPQTGFVAAFNSDCGGGTTLVAAQRATLSEAGQDRTQILISIDENGQEAVRFREASMVLDFSSPRFDENALLPPFLLANAVGPDGRVYTPRVRDQYAIEVYLPDGTLERVIERDFENWKRDERDMNRMNALVDAWMQGFPGELERDFEECEPAITEMFVTDDGTLWVQHSRSGRDQPDGVLLTFDTFDAEGRYLQEVLVVADGDPALDGVKFLGDGSVLLIRGYVLSRWASRGAQNVSFGEDEQTGPMEIVYCRVVD